MSFQITTGLEREIKFLVTGDIPPDSLILHSSLIRQTHLGSEKTADALFEKVKSRVLARMSHLIKHGIQIEDDGKTLYEIERILKKALQNDRETGRKYNLRVRMEKKTDAVYISTLTCKKVLSGENSEIREKIEYDISLPKKIALLLLGVRKDVIDSIYPIAGVTKRRYYFETPDGHHWCFDRFLGANFGLQTIEVELQHNGEYQSPILGIQSIPPSKLSEYSMRNLQKRTRKQFHSKKKIKSIDKEENMVT